MDVVGLIRSLTEVEKSRLLQELLTDMQHIVELRGHVPTKFEAGLWQREKVQAVKYMCGRLDCSLHEAVDALRVWGGVGNTDPEPKL